jgi:Na+-translocating ferredoxin:NAD+ oxidoreductase RnfG subunit
MLVYMKNNMKSKICYKRTTWISVELTDEERQEIVEKLKNNKSETVLNIIFDVVPDPYFENECEYEEFIPIDENNGEATIAVYDEKGIEIWDNMSGHYDN